MIDHSPLAITGGTALPRASRATVHCLLAIDTLLMACLAVSGGKTQCADIVVSLGFRASTRGAGRLDVPPQKASVIIHSVAAHRELVQARSPIPFGPLEKLVGRLCHVAQIYCAIRLWLHAGYALLRARFRRGGARRPFLPAVRLRPGGRRERELLRLLDCAEGLLTENRGVPLAARPAFPAPDGAAGVWLASTDASGVHGVGGYAIHSARPLDVYLVSEYWPPEVLAALHACAEPDEAGEAPRFAMPAAEAFGMWAVISAAAAASGEPLTAAVALGDCLPAARAFNAAASGSAQVRRIIHAARDELQQWLAVHIPRELNVDADTLSHPRRLEQLLDTFRGTRVRPHVVRLGRRHWDTLAEALALPLAVDEHHPRFA